MLFGQDYKKEFESQDSIELDTITDLVIIQAKTDAKKKNDIENGYYKVLGVDAYNDFYLIFVVKDSVRSTIFSKKCLPIRGQQITIDSTYYFELLCKDTLDNGTCLTPIPHVTYFGKYSGYELGKLTIAKNLCGLCIKKRGY